MVIWSSAEVGVFFALIGMIILKIWTVWHVAKKSNATREGRLIFVWGITGLTAFAVAAKSFISYQMGI